MKQNQLCNKISHGIWAPATKANITCLFSLLLALLLLSAPALAEDRNTDSSRLSRGEVDTDANSNDEDWPDEYTPPTDMLEECSKGSDNPQCWNATACPGMKETMKPRFTQNGWIFAGGDGNAGIERFSILKEQSVEGSVENWGYSKKPSGIFFEIRASGPYGHTCKYRFATPTFSDALQLKREFTELHHVEHGLIVFDNISKWKADGPNGFVAWHEVLEVHDNQPGDTKD